MQEEEREEEEEAAGEDTHKKRRKQPTTASQEEQQEQKRKKEKKGKQTGAEVQEGKRTRSKIKNIKEKKAFQYRSNLVAQVRLMEGKTFTNLHKEEIAKSPFGHPLPEIVEEKQDVSWAKKNGLDALKHIACNDGPSIFPKIHEMAPDQAYSRAGEHTIGVSRTWKEVTKDKDEIEDDKEHDQEHMQIQNHNCQLQEENEMLRSENTNLKKQIAEKD
ncbi:hypothetical protein RHGRI_013446 [Rhododendron griersonianum]|uniref:Uncharacterized protein n=1 Tax=Rhododendron griersonianum TaxID=479676 RepID=A0AAV6K5X0_9ERIC|nr:hypothetical protein RHGRI_013446 [Rhododendron griersonianum]